MATDADWTAVYVLRIEHREGRLLVYVSISNDISDPTSVRRFVTSDFDQALDHLQAAFEEIL